MNEYFAMTMDTIEKCLAKEPTLKEREKTLQKIFYGRMNQYLDDGVIQDIKPTAVKFGMINLDVKLGSLEQAFDAFKNYNVDGYKVSGKTASAKIHSQIISFPQLMTFYINTVNFVNGKLCKNNSRFTFPNILQFDKQKDTLLFKLNKQGEELEKKIAKVQEILAAQEYKKHLECLRHTEQFLERQEYEEVSDATLGLKQLNYNYGLFGKEVDH